MNLEIEFMEQLPKAFFEIHRDNDQEGPGSDKSTLKAYGLLKELPEKPRIIDIGCGPGRQTLVLAKQGVSEIVAVDTHQPFLDLMMNKALKRGLTEKITPLNRSMDSLDLPDTSFDLIWSESAVFIMGFGNALKKWRPLLKPTGTIAITDALWLKASPPQELKKFWKIYPRITDLDGFRKIINESGMKLQDHFILPESDWYDYYRPLEVKVKELRAKCKDDPETVSYLDSEEREFEMYKKYSDYYGYAFFIIRK